MRFCRGRTVSPKEKHRRERQRRASLERADDDDEVLTFARWCKLNGISLRNGRRIIKAPGGPRVLQLSANRIGITRRANREWQASRERVA
jgi:hypothetical protein